VGRLSPKLQEFFAKQGVELELNESLEGPSSPSSSPRLQKKSDSQSKPRKGRGKIRSILNYVSGFKELKAREKLLVMLAVDAYSRKTFYQAKVTTACAQISCGRATYFRVLKHVAPKWLEKHSRPGKPNILIPSAMLRTYLGLSMTSHGDARLDEFLALAKGLPRCPQISGMFRRSQRI
jgi:hypothetical protein